jgi:hypothetical protein
MSPLKFMLRLMAILLLTWIFCATGGGAAESRRFVSLYAGRYSDTVFVDNLQFQHDFESSDVLVFSIGRQVGRYRELIDLELEGQVAAHWGRQNHQEINFAFTLRWLPFPWDRFVDTSFAFGNGLSYATADPSIEAENADNGRTAQWLYYILAEWAFGLDDSWELFWRIHHRSGVYGRMADNNAGSNFIGLGLRLRY